MLKIGEFAQICRVTVRTLRYYDEIGLLRPAHVDPWTGYRYYARDQAARLNRITTLKDLGLSLEQIGPLLDNDLAPAEVRGMLKLKEAELEGQMRELETQLSRVRVWLGEEKEKEMTKDEHARVVLIDAVEAFQRVEREIRHWQPRSYVQVRVVCMQAAGWKDADYDTIMTISGFGPSFAYHPKKFWPQYLAPSGCDERIVRATGFGWEWKRYETVEEYWQALKETIDAGNLSAVTQSEPRLARMDGQAEEAKRGRRSPLEAGEGYRNCRANWRMAARLEMPNLSARKLQTSWTPWAGQSGRLQPQRPVSG